MPPRPRSTIATGRPSRATAKPHGNLKLAERNRASWIVSCQPDISTRALARQIGVSPSLVRKWRREWAFLDTQKP